MNFLRNIVARDKNRYKDNEVELDISYITPRILAMSFPASGIESMYRNNIKSVSMFLQKKHNNKCLILNLSKREYNKDLF
jgi:hypothetical protein